MENTEQVKDTQKQPTWKKVVSIVLNVLFYAFIVFMLTFAIANIAAKNNERNIPNIFGNGFLSVASDSMEGNRDNSFFIGDLLIVKMPNDKRISKLVAQEDMISYYDKTIEQIVTHRLVDIIERDGVKIYVTQGDKVALDNPSAVYQENDDDLYLCETHLEQDILAIYSSKWSGGGKVLNFLQSKLGFGLVIVLPTALLLLYEGYVLVKNVLELNKQKLQKEFAEAKNFDPEEEKRKIREQLLKEMQEENEKKKNEEEN